MSELALGTVFTAALFWFLWTLVLKREPHGPTSPITALPPSVKPLCVSNQMSKVKPTTCLWVMKGEVVMVAAQTDSDLSRSRKARSTTLTSKRSADAAKVSLALKV